MEHRRLKACDVPREGLLKVERRGFRCLGFRCLGFRCVWGLGFGVFGFWGFGCLGVQVFGVQMFGVQMFGVQGSGVQVFRCSGVLVFGVLVGLMTFWKVKRVTREGAPKMAKIQDRVKSDIFKMTYF